VTNIYPPGKVTVTIDKKVDGKNIKPNTFYTLKNGEFIEADK
jgi:hypothetical protein